MANPVAIYSPDTAAPPPRGGAGSAQIIQIDVYRSGASPRFNPNRDFRDSAFGDSPQGARAAPLYGDNGRAPAADPVRGSAGFAPRFGNRRRSDSEFEAGRRRAPAGLSFAAQQIAQENLPPGVYFENYRPAVAAYAVAAERPTLPQPGQALEMTA